MGHRPVIAPPLRLGSLAALVLLAACSNDPPDSQNDRNSGEVVTRTEPGEVAPPDPSSSAESERTESPAPQTEDERSVAGASVQDTIPARFHGLWSEDLDHCRVPGHQRYDIGASRIGFFESTGIVRTVRVRGDYAAATVFEQYGDGPGTRYAFYMALEGPDRMRARYDTRDGFVLRRCPD